MYSLRRAAFLPRPNCIINPINQLEATHSTFLHLPHPLHRALKSSLPNPPRMRFQLPFRPQLLRDRHEPLCEREIRRLRLVRFSLENVRLATDRVTEKECRRDVRARRLVDGKQRTDLSASGGGNRLARDGVGGLETHGIEDEAKVVVGGDADLVGDVWVALECVQYRPVG